MTPTDVDAANQRSIELVLAEPRDRSIGGKGIYRVECLGTTWINAGAESEMFSPDYAPLDVGSGRSGGYFKITDVIARSQTFARLIQNPPPDLDSVLRNAYPDLYDDGILDYMYTQEYAVQHERIIRRMFIPCQLKYGTNFRSFVQGAVSIVTGTPGFLIVPPRESVDHMNTGVLYHLEQDDQDVLVLEDSAAAIRARIALEQLQTQHYGELLNLQDLKHEEVVQLQTQHHCEDARTAKRSLLMTKTATIAAGMLGAAITVAVSYVL